MTDPSFYVVEYEWERHGLPAFVGGTYNHPEFEWDLLNPEASCAVPIVKSYELHVTDPALRRLDFDFYDPRSPLVSRAFLSVCDELHVKYRAVPLRVTFAAQAAGSQEFFFFLPCQGEALLDRESSQYQEEGVLETGEVMRDRYFPQHPVYSWIRHFEVMPTSLHLFHCIEIFQLAASEQFRNLVMEHGLKGVKLVPLDASFRYDPWGEIAA